jgi:hypothetical protein
MKDRHSYGYFHDQSDAEKHLKKMKKSDRGTSKNFSYRCEKRDRSKEGCKRWLAYRTEKK